MLPFHRQPPPPVTIAEGKLKHRRPGNRVEIVSAMADTVRGGRKSYPAPPPAVRSHAAPHALASSRTRKM